MPVIGTAGHVDHGKSTLVLALTGRDPDRWAEEKERGLTIDLGFAWTRLPGDIEAGFVDVPGHERFIKNMLAGIEGIDVALLVVAADEGWMPQSEEHLAILDLLDIRHGVVALTRTDLVDSETAQLAALEIEDELEGTSLEGAPIVPTAAPLGRGIEEIKDALAAAVRARGENAGDGRMRLWIDRSFPISGAGTVVTGTLLGGPIVVGDPAAVYPAGATGRVRSLQSHERDHDRIEPGNRAAVNIAGIDRGSAPRGSMLGTPGRWRTTSTLLLRLRMVRRAAERLTDRGAYHLHAGSAAVAARLRLVAGDFDPYVTALVRLDAALPLTMGDRVILRDVGRRAVVAGGVVLDPAPVPRRRAAAVTAGRLAALPPDPHERATLLLDIRGRARTEDITAWSGGLPPAAQPVDGEVFAPSEIVRLVVRAEDLVAGYHEANPLRPGRPKGDLAGSLGVTIDQLDRLVVPEAAHLVDDGAFVRHRSHTASRSTQQTARWNEAQDLLRREGNAVPRAGQLGLDDELLHALIREGSLIRVADDLVFLPDQIDDIEARLMELPDGFSVADFRDAAGLTRRHAVPLLEWFDRRGVTRRTGDTRSVRRQ